MAIRKETVAPALRQIPEQTFDDLTRLAAQICETPMSVVSLADGERLWLRSGVGIDVDQMELKNSFCGHVVQTGRRLLVTNAAEDERFKDLPLVTAKPGIHFYAGGPLVAPEGHVVGSLCVLDYNVRNLTQTQIDSLEALGRHAAYLIDLYHKFRNLEILSLQLEGELSEREMTEEALQITQKSLGEAQRIANVGSWEWNVETDEWLWTDEVYRIFGFIPGDPEITHEIFCEGVHPDDRARRETVRQTALAGGEAYGLDYRIIRPSGEERTLHSEAEIYRDETGSPIRMVGTIHDVTERVQAEEELRRHREELSHVARVQTMAELATSLAHELNQPLTAILTNAQFLHRSLSTDKRTEELDGALEDIVDNAKRAGDIIRRQHHFVSKGEREKSSLDINELIQELEIFTRSDTQKNNVNVVFDLAADLAKTIGDRVQLEQVLLNLLRNSMEAMKDLDNEGSELVVKISMSEPDVIMIAIRDGGPPLNDEVFEQLFQPFYSTKAGGLGMGLPISRSLIESHGGRLWATKNEDQGITVCLTLPCEEVTS